MKEEQMHESWKKFKNKDKNKDKKVVKEEMEEFGEEQMGKEVLKNKEEHHSKPKRAKPKLLEEEVTINFKLKPIQLIKWSLIVLLIIFVFFLGRLSVGCDTDSTTSTVSTAEVAEEVEAADSGEDEGLVNSVSGFFTGLFSESANGATPTGGSTVENNTTDGEAVVEEPAVSETEDSEEVVAEESTVSESEDEEIITSYNSVALAITDININWKGTWGKMEKIKYTIKNNEIGTVKPDHFVMLVKGYDDVEKSVPLAPSSKTVKSKTSVSSTATIPSGFSYNEVTAGDLSSVVVTIILYDASDKEMATFKKGYNLQG